MMPQQEVVCGSGLVVVCSNMLTASAVMLHWWDYASMPHKMTYRGCTWLSIQLSLITCMWSSLASLACRPMVTRLGTADGMVSAHLAWYQWRVWPESATETSRS